MRKILAAIAIAVPANVAVAEDKKDDGYISLFNGKDFTGWKLPSPLGGEFTAVTETKNADGKVVAYVAKTKKGADVTIWQIKDGCIVGGGPMTHIFTETNDYTNFHFRVEFKINDKGNSGMFFRSGFNAGIPKGYECQINATHSDPVKTGSIYPNAANGLDKDKEKHVVMNNAGHKPDEWVVQEVIADGPKLTTIVNGKVAVEWVDPKHTFKTGHFALQGHDPGSVMTFRKVEVKVIK